MIIWVLMIFDIFSLASLSLAHFNLMSSAVTLYYSSGYLVSKGLIFRDVMSLMDLVIGLYILLVAFFGFSSFFYWFILTWFIYKFAFTLLA